MTGDLELEDDDYNAIVLPSPPAHSTTEVVVVMPLACAGMRLDQALASLLPEQSRSRLAVLIKEGAVLVDGELAAGKSKVAGGEKIAVALRPRDDELAFHPENIVLNIVYEDAAVMVIDKPPGLVVHPAAGNWSGTLLNGLLYRNAALARVPRAGIVHRLDKDTSGLMVVAKTETAQLDLVRQLQARSVKREYVALAQGCVARAGTVDAPIGRHPRSRTRMAVAPDKGKPAVTHYRVLERFARHTLLECRLETGRTHQIRVHLQSIGHPIEGDTIYGARAAGKDAAEVIRHFGRQALHAQRLGFVHPETRKTLNFEAPLPDDMRLLIDAVRAAA